VTNFIDLSLFDPVGMFLMETNSLKIKKK